jgi:hypothetical protein
MLYRCKDEIKKQPWIGLICTIIALVICLLYSWIIMWFVRKKHSNSQKCKLVKPLESQSLPVYIGLFVIAFSLPGDSDVMQIFVSIILFLLWMYIERNSYFNIFWLFLGYHYYEATTTDNEVVTLITKKSDLKGEKKFGNLARLNNFTFLEVKVK